jgi:Flp pilus assembly protein TadD
VAREFDDDEAWGLLGMALSLLGHFRAAKTAYIRACSIAPHHPGHAHNLGHLIDAAFGKPNQAIPWLERAFRSAPDVPEIASSLAHAMVGAGRPQEAHTLLRRYANLAEDVAQNTVRQWQQR